MIKVQVYLDLFYEGPENAVAWYDNIGFDAGTQVYSYGFDVEAKVSIHQFLDQYGFRGMRINTELLFGIKL